MVVEFKPAGYHAVTPYLVVDGAERLITFMLDVLGGTEMMRLPGPDGRTAMPRSALVPQW